MHCVTKMKDRSHMILNGCRKVISQNLIFEMVCIGGSYLNIIKPCITRRQLTSYLTVKSWELFVSCQEVDEDAHNSPLLFHIVLEFLARKIKQDKELKGKEIRVWKEKVKWSLFADDMICTENSKDFIRTLLELINKFSKIAGCKVYKKQLCLCTLTMNYQAEKLRRRSHFQ